MPYESAENQETCIDVLKALDVYYAKKVRKHKNPFPDLLANCPAEAHYDMAEWFSMYDASHVNIINVDVKENRHGRMKVINYTETGWSHFLASDRDNARYNLDGYSGMYFTQPLRTYRAFVSDYSMLIGWQFAEIISGILSFVVAIREPDVAR